MNGGKGMRAKQPHAAAGESKEVRGEKEGRKALTCLQPKMVLILPQRMGGMGSARKHPETFKDNSALYLDDQSLQFAYGVFNV